MTRPVPVKGFPLSLETQESAPSRSGKQELKDFDIANPHSSSPAPLPRAVGRLGSTAIVIGTIIGSGIFLVPHDVAARVGSVGALVAIWVVGGALSLAGALSIAELGAATPEAGGVYIYLRQAYGKLFAFLYGWAALTVTESGAIATLAVAFGIYSGTFYPLTHLQRRLISSLVIALLTVVNIVGVRKGAAVQAVFMAAKLLGISVILGFAFFSTGIARPLPTQPLPTPHTTFASFGVGLIAALWAYQGWHILSYASGEVKDPGRVLPWSYMLGTSVVVLVYLSANLAYLRVLPLGVLADDRYQSVAAKTMEILAGPKGAAFVSALILCSIFGALNGNILGGGRVCFAMARDEVFFAAVGRVHPRFQTPALALVIQGIWSIVLANIGSFRQLYTYVITSGWFFYGMAALGVLLLRRSMPALERPYRVWGYPVVPVVFALVCFVVIGNSLIQTPLASLAGLGFILVGIPLYYGWMAWGRRRSAP